ASPRPTDSATALAGAADDQAAGGNAGARGDQDRAVTRDLVDRGAADLADRLGDAVHAVDVGLAELATVRVDRQAAAQLDRAAGDEVPGLAAPAEAELLQLDEHVRGEVDVQDGGPDVGGGDSGLPPQLPADQAHLRQAGQVVAVVAGHGELVRAGSLRGRADHGRQVAQVAGPVQAGDDQGDGAVTFLAAVEQRRGSAIHREAWCSASV